jgi:tripartite-type tricarboxylate transporter receptor subunit TctC
MIRSILVALISGLLSVAAQSQIAINFVWPYAPSHGATPVFFPVLAEANNLQDKYNFIFESRPGADGLIAINHMNTQPAHRVVVIAPGFVDLSTQGKINEGDYSHLVGFGDMCFAVWMKNADPVKGFDSIKDQGEITIGNVGWGNGSHLIALSVAEKYNMKVRNVVFKSNREGLVNLAQGGGVTLVVDKLDAFNDLRDRASVQANPAAVTCGQRVKAWPNTKTLAEQGIQAKAPWLIVSANKAMPAEIQRDITDILNQAIVKVGSDKIMELSNLHPVVFHKNKSVDDFYKERATLQKILLKKYQPIIDADRGVTK